MPGNLQAHAALLVFLSIIPTAAFGGEKLDLPWTFGNEAGCHYYKFKESKNESSAYINNEGLRQYEESCGFVNVRNVKKELSKLHVVQNAWSVKLICQSEGNAVSYDALITLDDANGSQSLTITPEDERQPAMTLEPCR
jgi:hypothetical protein